MNRTSYSWNQFDQDIARLAVQISQSGWRPDYVVGVSRGGCVPAVSLSHALGVPMRPLQVSLRDGEEIDCVSDCAMAEDAFGYSPYREEASSYTKESVKNILIVDDINDTGATFKWIQEDWKSGCLPNHTRWSDVWHNNVRFAVLHNNEGSEFKTVDYSANYINKVEKDVWIVYPWEALSPNK